MIGTGDPVDSSGDFEATFWDVLNNKQVPETSSYHCGKLHITTRETNCLNSIIKSLKLATRNENHISKILVGLKGGGQNYYVRFYTSLMLMFLEYKK
jgi:hypothetical protein